MDKKELLKLIDKYEHKISIDNENMELDPNSMYWYDDYEINSSMLSSLYEKLEKVAK